ncbi:hypothetical protein SASPL_131504 [Salvia splendens]|uniref:Uncharacterized protein n=1 Tax=Salvia splendens TaxID=180675 RepID=A0A8X8ZKX4_SALSN|nr:hypothetical protein SASPL_131501 [Salvia splendens]KAG6408491.1 hypothetical protein SASPL_131504 [Salvia splendens]
MIFSLLFLCLNLSSLFRFSSARGAQLHSYNQSGFDDRNYGISGRRMYSMTDFQMTEEDYNARLEKLAKGYMSNSDLQNAMQEFNSRCPNISRIYRYLFRHA